MGIWSCNFFTINVTSTTSIADPFPFPSPFAERKVQRNENNGFVQSLMFKGRDDSKITRFVLLNTWLIMLLECHKNQHCYSILWHLYTESKVKQRKIIWNPRAVCHIFRALTKYLYMVTHTNPVIQENTFFLILVYTYKQRCDFQISQYCPNQPVCNVKLLRKHKCICFHRLMEQYCYIKCCSQCFLLRTLLSSKQLSIWNQFPYVCPTKW